MQRQMQAFRVCIEDNVREGGSNLAPVAKIFFRVHVARVMQSDDVVRLAAGLGLDHHLLQVGDDMLNERRAEAHSQVVLAGILHIREPIGSLLSIAHGLTGQGLRTGVELFAIVREGMVGGNAETDDTVLALAALEKLAIVFDPLRLENLRHRETPVTRPSGEVLIARVRSRYKKKSSVKSLTAG